MIIFAHTQIGGELRSRPGETGDIGFQPIIFKTDRQDADPTTI
jgi:hypothetical protein